MGTLSHRQPHRCLRSLFSRYNSPRKVTSEMHTSCSYSLRAPSLQRSHLGSRPPLTDCSGVAGDGTNPPGCLRGMLCPVFAEICGTPGYLAPEILQCSMDDEHQGYGKEVDM